MTTLQKLRHYSATELITSGVDVRTVAGRLGHSGGATTLRTYIAWVSEVDQCTATMPRARPAEPRDAGKATHLQICMRAADQLDTDAGTDRVDHVVADKGQDLHPAQWRVIRAARRRGPGQPVPHRRPTPADLRLQGVAAGARHLRRRP